jgi:hypothetical protein
MRFEQRAKEFRNQLEIEQDRLSALTDITKRRLDIEKEPLALMIREDYLKTLADLGLQVESNRLAFIADFGERLITFRHRLTEENLDPEMRERIVQMADDAFDRVRDRLVELATDMFQPTTSGPGAPPHSSKSGSAVSVPIDDVHFSITAPAILKPGMSFELQFWAHLESQRKLLLERARLVTGISDTLDLILKSEGPYQLERGAKLSVRLSVEGLEITPSHKVLLWMGEVGAAAFIITVPAAATLNPHLGVASLRVNGMQIARTNFALNVGTAAPSVSTVSARAALHKKAFASYASEDRDAVIARVQGMETALKGLHVFVDVVDLRSGQYWEQELWNVIPKSDIFYLFWCRQPRSSEWVRKEWQCALKERGLDYIDPVPLESPEFAPPPPELAAKHFNDPLVAFLVSGDHPRPL